MATLNCSLYSGCLTSSFIYQSVSRPKPFPNRALNIVRSTASTFKREYPLLSLRLYSSFLRLLPHLYFTFIPPFFFSPITCCRKQFPCKTWPIQLAFRLRISCRIFLCSLALSNTSSFLTWSIQLIFSIFLQHHIKSLQVFLIYLLTYIHVLTPHTTVLLEKLTGLQLVKKFPAFYRARKFITVFTSARHLSLSWASSV
jgi:hypothetical protein